MSFLRDAYDFALYCGRKAEMGIVTGRGVRYFIADPDRVCRIHNEGGKGMDFAYALNALKEGKRVARSGWNGKDMWLCLQEGYPNGIPINANTAKATGIPEGTVCKFRPYIMMFTAQGDFVPWLASQTDILAEDWGIV